MTDRLITCDMNTAAIRKSDLIVLRIVQPIISSSCKL